MRRNAATRRFWPIRQNDGSIISEDYDRVNREIYECLCAVTGEEAVLVDEPMKRHTTFRTGGPADFLVQPRADEVAVLVQACRDLKVPYTLIGNGSNLLIGDKGIRGVVIEIGKRMAAIEVRENRIRAEAGALLSGLAAQAAAAGLAGLEFASGIPGSVGGAVAMNAGAYGGEIKDVLNKAVLLLPDGSVREFVNEEMQFSYRRSIVQDDECVVLEAYFTLQPDTKEAIRARMQELKEKRTAKQPLDYPSAGSTFKRPPGYFAAALIEEAGLKGYTVGGAQVSEKHSGFVINTGGATSADIRTLIRDVQRIVNEKFGVELETEVRLLGEFA